MARFLVTGRATAQGGGSIVRAALVSQLQQDGHTVYTNVPDGFETVDYLVTSSRSRNNRTMKYRWAEANGVAIITYPQMWRIITQGTRLRGTSRVPEVDPYRHLPDNERPDDIGAEARMESEGMEPLVTASDVEALERIAGRAAGDAARAGEELERASAIDRSEPHTIPAAGTPHNNPRMQEVTADDVRRVMEKTGRIKTIGDPPTPATAPRRRVHVRR